MREWWGDENEAASDPGLNLKKKKERKSSFDLKPLHAVHRRPNDSKPKVMHVFS